MQWKRYNFTVHILYEGKAKFVVSYVIEVLHLWKFMNKEFLKLLMKYLFHEWGFQGLHCKYLPHENYGHGILRGPCRENLHYLLKSAVRTAGKPCDNCRSYNYHGVSLEFLHPFSIDCAAAIQSPRSFHGVKICSACSVVGLTLTALLCICWSLGKVI